MKANKKYWRITTILVLVVLGMSVATTATLADSPTTRVPPSHSEPYDRSYSESRSLLGQNTKS